MIEYLKLVWDVTKNLKKWREKVIEDKYSRKVGGKSPLVVAQRFVRLFESHGVNRNQIHLFYGEDLNLSDFLTDESLIKVLADKHLCTAADLFAVNLQWLYGDDVSIYQTHIFYKAPSVFQDFINTLSLDYYKTRIQVLKSDAGEIDTLLVISEEILLTETQSKVLGDKCLYRHHISDEWIFNYWKCRAYLTSCIAIASQNKLQIFGETLPAKLINEFEKGNKFLPINTEFGTIKRYGMPWYPEDLIYKPDFYTNGIDEGHFGKIESLALWLELCEKGFMDTGYKVPVDEFEEAFEQAKYKAQLTGFQNFVFSIKKRLSPLFNR
jgi:hypothetical protein